MHSERDAYENAEFKRRARDSQSGQVIGKSGKEAKVTTLAAQALSVTLLSTTT